MPAVHPQEESERQRILQALEAARWNRRQAAQALGMPYSTLRYKIIRLGIRP
jgi:transcriptional regulator with GAF, ATPase, and Fis domain